ncbi:baculoviral IAP repeat-containing protein 7-A-like [Paramacrobiotus metropolitanus]|uniref:baculoviral IAP repeat-containing protein 7-A-like n=1 Tax=Paramacrobiotus metropolitanus TaxID=2943436 RepID=UPI0024457AAF|nr:baculoviral IAP repeat-containing protein 7-A-like [Paramacrobiotus metropolitanus]XP_055341741.1 baculoviral IAP repeat-containing protein 7-A-like [Paramacrobiotus metropolitanus]XP_055341742.1 baculoviral IAP repeat-containing protein 7-A-like [Paramacrobiotus metropolitanus]
MSDNENWTPDNGPEERNRQNSGSVNNNNARRAPAAINATSLDHPQQEPAQFAYAPELAQDNAERRGPMDDYGARLRSFETMKWKATLTKSRLTNPKKMAAAGFYCTGTESAKCYACLKDLEGWDPSDEPVAEHTKHCPLCSLSREELAAFRKRSWREEIRLRVAAEYQQRRLLQMRYHDHSKQAFNAIAKQLTEKITLLQNGRELEEEL